MSFVDDRAYELAHRLWAEAPDGSGPADVDDLYESDDYRYELSEAEYEWFLDDLAAQDADTVAETRRGIARQARIWTRVIVRQDDSIPPHPSPDVGPVETFASEPWALSTPEAFAPFVADAYDAWALLENDEDGVVRAGILDDVGAEVAAAWHLWRRAYLCAAGRAGLRRFLDLGAVRIRRRFTLDHNRMVLNAVFSRASRAVAYRTLAPPGELLRAAPIAAHAPPRRAYPVLLGEALEPVAA